METTVHGKQLIGEFWKEVAQGLRFTVVDLTQLAGASSMYAVMYHRHLADRVMC